LQGAVDQPAGTSVRIGEAPLQQVQRAGDRHQEIVEVVRDAAGELADGFQLLRFVEFGQRFLARGGFLAHALFERGGELAQGLLGRALLGDVGMYADPFADLTLAVEGGNRAHAEGSPVAVHGTQAMLALVNALLGHRLLPARQRAGHVVGVQRRGPPVAGIFLRGLSGQRRPAGLFSLHAATGTVGPEHALHRLDRGPEALLAVVQRGEPLARLVLAAPATQGGLRETDQGGRMERPLQEGDVAQHGEQATGGGIALDTAAAGHEDEREIGPLRLRAQPGGERLQVCLEQALFGHQRRACPRGHALHQRTQRGAGKRAQPGLGEDRPCDLRIASPRRKDQDPFGKVRNHVGSGKSCPSESVPIMVGTPRNTPWKCFSGAPNWKPPDPRRYSRMVSSCALARFFTMEIARRTLPTASK